MDGAAIARLGLVVHPSRELSAALETIERWGAEHGAEVVQVPASGQDRRVAEAGDPAECDVIAALGGDGTTLAALRTGAAARVPVMGVACGSLGVLTAVTAGELAGALDRLLAGDWTPRSLPAVTADFDGTGTLAGVNDLVVVRDGAGQVTAEVRIDGELFIRVAGDGIVVATQLGSSAYTLAAGGPLLPDGCDGFVLTALAPHGGRCPPLVAGAGSRLSIALHPGSGGARIELDGRVESRVDPHAARMLDVGLRRDYATLVMLGGEESMLAGLRRRRVIIDSPRMLARAERESAAADRNPVKRV